MPYSINTQYQPNTQQQLPDACTSCEAKRFGLCGLLNDTSASLLLARSRTAHYESCEEIAVQGEHSDKIGIVASGLVKIVLITEDGEDHLLELLKPGQIVGDPCKPENAFTWEAVTPAKICWINRKTLNSMMQEHPQIYQAYLEVTARQLEAQRLWAAAMRGRKTLQRIGYWIVQQVLDARGTDTPVIPIDLTRRDLASLLDMTVETLCRGLHQLADNGAISLLASDKIKVLNMVKLRIFARCEDSRIAMSLGAHDPTKPVENTSCMAQYQNHGHHLHLLANARRQALNRE